MVSTMNVTTFNRKTPPMTGMMIRRAAHILLHNLFVEAGVVLIVAMLVVAAKLMDRAFHTCMKRGLIDHIRRISQDSIGGLRRAQIKYIFRRKYGLRKIKIRLADGSYWLSVPCVVTGIDHRRRPQKYMAKIINDRSALKHRYMTTLRNLGVIADGAEIWFGGHESARDMIEYEGALLGAMRSSAVDAPEVLGLHKLNEDDYMLVMRYIEGEPLSMAPLSDDVIDRTFRMLAALHRSGLVHGDMKLDNLIYSEGRVFVVDCLKIDSSLRAAQSFDLACAICALSQRSSVSAVMRHAKASFSAEELDRAGALLYIALSKVDIDLPDYSIEELRAVFSSRV